MLYWVIPSVASIEGMIEGPSAAGTPDAEIVTSQFNRQWHLIGDPSYKGGPDFRWKADRWIVSSKFQAGL